MKTSVLDSKCCRLGFSSILGILGLQMKTRRQLLGLSQLFGAVHVSVQYISTLLPNPGKLTVFTCSLHLCTEINLQCPPLSLEYSTFAKSSFCHILLICIYAFMRQLTSPYNSWPAQTCSLFLLLLCWISPWL